MKKYLTLPVMLITTCVMLFAQKGPAAPSQLDRPKLVVGIVVDQMRWDYLYRFYNKYSNGGF